MKIFKYPVQIADTFELLLPEGAEVLSVDAQNDGPQMWAKIDDQAMVTLRRFHVRGTGHAFTGEEGRYVGTFQTAGGAFVWHLFESNLMTQPDVTGLSFGDGATDSAFSSVSTTGRSGGLA